MQLLNKTILQTQPRSELKVCTRIYVVLNEAPVSLGFHQSHILLAMLVQSDSSENSTYSGQPTVGY